MKAHFENKMNDKFISIFKGKTFWIVGILYFIYWLVLLSPFPLSGPELVGAFGGSMFLGFIIASTFWIIRNVIAILNKK